MFGEHIIIFCCYPLLIYPILLSYLSYTVIFLLELGALPEKMQKIRKYKIISGLKTINDNQPIKMQSPPINFSYLFSWDDVPGNDSMRILKYMRDNLKIDWAENAEIKKSDNSEAITLTKGENSLIFKLNKEENKVNLEISGGETYEYILKKEKGKLNIYVYFMSNRGVFGLLYQ